MNWFFKSHAKHAVPRPHHKNLKGDRFRKCRIEPMESRQLLSVTPIQLGATFFEDHSGDDVPSALTSDGKTLVADLFEVSYTGGANGTKLTSLTLNLHDTSLFDTVAGGAGYGGAFPLTIISHAGFELVDNNGNEISNVTVPDGATTLTLNFKDFAAGDKLVFSIDVDEAVGGNETVDGSELVDQHLTISGIPYTAKGATLDATFSMPDRPDIDATAAFTHIDRSVDATDEYFTGDLFNLLPNVEYNNDAAKAYMPTVDAPETNMYEFTAAALTTVTLSDISGTVYHDLNGDNIQESGEPGIPNVTLTLYKLVGDDYVPVTTGAGATVTTTTDANGDYTFSNLVDGTYEVVETQPIAYDSVGASTVDGHVASVNSIDTIALGGTDSVANDFSEIQYSLSGVVYYDANGNNIQDAGESGIQGVTLTLYKFVGGAYVPVTQADGTTPVTTTTNADGDYTFSGLLNGAYRVVETQPNDYASVYASTVNGTVDSADVLSAIVLGMANKQSVANDFSETQFTLSGCVYYDADDSGTYNAGDSLITDVDVTISLYKLEGGSYVLADQTTTVDGVYRFKNLAPGTYRVDEGPEAAAAGYLNGADNAGGIGDAIVLGTAGNDTIAGVQLDDAYTNYAKLASSSAFDNTAENYDFGELLPASVSGLVFVDNNGDNQYDPNVNGVISGVKMNLLDNNGKIVQTTTTDENGKYSFIGLTPGVYSVVEIQPSGYLEGGDSVGFVSIDGTDTAVGALDGVDKITSIALSAGDDGVEYDFWEIKPATISGYVFQDGPVIVLQNGDPMPYIPSVRDGQLTPDDTRLAGVTLELCDASGTPLLDSHGDKITTTTDADGYYEFTGLKAGQYSIIEIQPTGYVTGVDTAGTAGGLVVNQYSTLDVSVLSTLAVTTSDTAIVHISLAAGQTAVQYNFSEVLVKDEKGPPGFPLPPIPPMLINPTPAPIVDYVPFVEMYSLMPETIKQLLSGGGGGPGGYTWHLSVIDAGQPRQDDSGDAYVQVSQSSIFDPVSWTGAEMDQAVWILADADGNVIKKVRFGMKDAVPVTGDWDGAGETKIGVFMEGYWFLDINGNGVWDKGDLWVKLGNKDDQPITGDWNGDGKTDIGIFGPTWIGDMQAIASEPGLPDSQNPPTPTRPKNVPPDPAQAAIGFRTLKKSNVGKMRSDLIDHVFRFGEKGDIALAGDWNGDGIYTIGVFRNGVWLLDMVGNGHWSKEDLAFEFGQPGDIAIVGDWTGDGITKVGVYRNGTFYLDTNNNHQLDAEDKVIHLGGPGDKPVTGDWTGDGVTKVGVYESSPAASVPLQASRK